MNKMVIELINASTNDVHQVVENNYINESVVDSISSQVMDNLGYAMNGGGFKGVQVTHGTLSNQLLIDNTKGISKNEGDGKGIVGDIVGYTPLGTGYSYVNSQATNTGEVIHSTVDVTGSKLRYITEYPTTAANGKITDVYHLIKGRHFMPYNIKDIIGYSGDIEQVSGGVIVDEYIFIIMGDTHNVNLSIYNLAGNEISSSTLYIQNVQVTSNNKFIYKYNGIYHIIIAGIVIKINSIQTADMEVLAIPSGLPTRRLYLTVVDYTSRYIIMASYRSYKNILIYDIIGEKLLEGAEIDGRYVGGIEGNIVTMDGKYYGDYNSASKNAYKEVVENFIGEYTSTANFKVYVGDIGQSGTVLNKNNKYTIMGIVDGSYINNNGEIVVGIQSSAVQVPQIGIGYIQRTRGYYIGSSGASDGGIVYISDNYFSRVKLGSVVNKTSEYILRVTYEISLK